ncbi:hypothetical protein AKH19_03005 [Pelagibacteraceae bacterium GOM-A1]|nr:hypothetical protein AKH19_03005 [Pelagibacteraceae bacterium GOM-A1]
MQRNLVLILLLILFNSSQSLAKTFNVKNSKDSGPESLRHALLKASKSKESSKILITTEDEIIINSTLEYTGLQPLDIVGSGQSIKTTQNQTLLFISNGADLTISNLNFYGVGGFSIKKGGWGKGIFVDVRDDQKGLVNVILNNVSVNDVASHGIHISDCSLADDCGGGQGGGGEGSDASIKVVVDNLTISNVGNGRFDADGFRIDERGIGDIDFKASNSLFTLVGADGVELDEGNAGNVNATVNNSSFVLNGAYCDPKLLKPFMPKQDEGEFDDNVRKEDSIPGKIKGTPDDRCFEREVDLYDSGFVKEFEFGIDLDDGFDIDEAGPGNLVVTINNSFINGNLDEGLDFDEANNGDIFLTINNTISINNTDDGFKNSEEDDGSVIASIDGVIAVKNGGKGIVLEEEGVGDVRAFIESTITNTNDDSDKTGLEAVQEDVGSGIIKIVNSQLFDGIDAEGVKLK